MCGVEAGWEGVLTCTWIANLGLPTRAKTTCVLFTSEIHCFSLCVLLLQTAGQARLASIWVRLEGLTQLRVPGINHTLQLKVSKRRVTHKHTRIGTHTYVHACKHTNKHANTHTYTHTHKHVQPTMPASLVVAL
jgi:hypothetical protein